MSASPHGRATRRQRQRPPGLDLELRIDEQDTKGDILHISPDSLTIEIVPVADAPPGIDSRLSGSWLNTPDGKAVLLEMTVKDAREENGRHVLQLTPANDPTRAVMWYATERLGAKYHRESRQARQPAPAIPHRGRYTEGARLDRLQFVRDQTGHDMADLETMRLDPTQLKGNIENLIGTIEIPVGLAGPLLVSGAEAQGLCYAPYATTEGALVASATRGAKAITRAGGVTTRVLRQNMMRVPMFALTSLEGAVLFANWVRDHFNELREQAARVSRHGRLVDVDPIVIGKMVHLYFSYETGDAAGQNMTTACTWQACQWLLEQTRPISEIQIENFQIEANVSGDKKVTWRSFIVGRGIRVVAECVIPADILIDVLKVTPEQLAQSHQAVLVGSINSGMIGTNINVANTIAGIFAATGQDIASVHESSIAQLHMQPVDGGLYASMLLPALIVGTVGGGTHLPGQHALLEMMGCAGAGKVARFAEIIAGFCLALDLSTLSAVATGEFASAHERLGRNRPVQWLRREDITPEFLQEAVASAAQGAVAVRVEDLPEPAGSSIVAELTARKVQRLVGMLPLRVHCQAAGTVPPVDLMLKVKPLDAEVMLMVDGLASMCGPGVATTHRKFRDRTGFAACHKRELFLAGVTDPRIADYRPATHAIISDDRRELYVLAMEHLAGLELMDQADDVSGWTATHRTAAIEALARIHSVWLGKTDELREQPWIGHVASADSMTEMTPLWEALGDHAATEFPQLIDAKTRATWHGLIQGLPEWWPRLAAQPWTLCHNDYNPRNLAFRRLPDGALRVCVWDWELATPQAPQHDLAELLAFVLRDLDALELAEDAVELHRTLLQAAAGTDLPAAAWRDGFGWCLRDLAINRFGLYLMAHTFRHYGFMERAVRALYRMIDHFTPA